LVCHRISGAFAFGADDHGVLYHAVIRAATLGQERSAFATLGCIAVVSIVSNTGLFFG
jgi:hypothetical protein